MVGLTVSTYDASKVLEYFVGCSFGFIHKVPGQEYVVIPSISHLLGRGRREGFIPVYAIKFVFVTPVVLHP